MSEYTHLGLSIALGRPEDCHEAQAVAARGLVRLAQESEGRES